MTLSFAFTATALCIRALLPAADCNVAKRKRFFLSCRITNCTDWSHRLQLPSKNNIGFGRNAIITCYLFGCCIYFAESVACFCSKIWSIESAFIFTSILILCSRSFWARSSTSCSRMVVIESIRCCICSLVSGTGATLLQEKKQIVNIESTSTILFIIP